MNAFADSPSLPARFRPVTVLSPWSWPSVQFADGAILGFDNASLAIQFARKHNQSLLPNPADGEFIADPNDPNFWSATNRPELAKLGIFSIDQPAHRAKRAAEEGEKAELEAAYRRLGLDREKVKDTIAAAMETQLTNGVWARSTGRFARAVRGFDRYVLNTARDADDVIRDVVEDTLALPAN